MPPDVSLADVTISRLQKHAQPLTDTFDTVICRLLDHYEASNIDSGKPGQPIGTKGTNMMVFDPTMPPQLKFTTCTHITVAGEKLPKQITYWNNLLIAVIEEVHKKGKDVQTIHEMMHVANSVVGKREDSGYKFIPSVGLSVQGAESNAAFKQAYLLATVNKVKFTVQFVWQTNERAAHPGRYGYLQT